MVVFSRMSTPVHPGLPEARHDLNGDPRMKDFTHENLAAALLPHRTPMLSSVIELITDDPDLTATRRRDMISGLRRMATALGQDPSNVPVDPKWLQPRLEAVAPAAIGLSPKTWSNLISNARAALAHLGIVGRRANRDHDLAPAWRDLWRLARNTGKIHDSLSRFIYFLDRLGVAPEEVSVEHVQLFHQALTRDEIRKNPAASLRNAVNAWNRAVDHAPGWPRTRLTALPPKVDQIKLARDTYPPSFIADILRFETAADDKKLTSESNERPLAQESVFTYVRVIERFAGGAVRAGVAPERITDISALLSPEIAETGIDWFFQRYDYKKTPGLRQLIETLHQVSRRHCGPHAHPHLEKIAAKFKAKPPGLTEKNRERLRPMLVPQMTPRIVTLPSCLMKQASRDTSHKACLLREQAIAIAILLYCPIRRSNLVSIDTRRHLQRPGDGKVYLAFPRDEVKNRMALEFELPAPVVIMIDTHLALRSPRLCPPGTPFLFPKRCGSRPMQAEHLSENVKKCFKRELGLEINLHLFRHFAAHVLLDEDPEHYEAVRRLLGHSRLSNTINAYTGIETINVCRRYAKKLEAIGR